MKLVQLTTLAFSALLPCVAVDAAPRKVICENFTATWCGYCPDVANGIIMLLDEFPDNFYSMQVHGSDSYSTAWGNARNSFYSVPGYPTVWLNGLLKIEGSYGSPGANYSQIRSRYMQLANEATDVTINMCGSSVDGDTYSVSAQVGIENGGSGKTMTIHIVQVLHDYPSSPSYNYGCLKQGSGQTITLTPGETQDVTFEFDLDSSSQSHPENVYYLAWAQTTNTSGPSEVYQAEKHVHNSGDCQIDHFYVGAKGDFTTIGEALAVSGTGDTITVMPGTYYENIDFNGASIVMESMAGAEETIIDGGGSGSVVRMYSMESATLRGFTIQNGSSPLGGGVLINGEPIIEDCIIKHNTAQIGGGIYNLSNGSAGPSVMNTSFCNNSTSHIYGEWVDNSGNIFEDSCDGDSDCPADITGDAWVNVSDLLAVIDAWGSDDQVADINDDGVVDVGDLLEVVGSWGACQQHLA